MIISLLRYLSSAVDKIKMFFMLPSANGKIGTLKLLHHEIREIRNFCRAPRKIAHFAPASQVQASHRNTSCAVGPVRFGIFRGATKED